MASAPSEPTPVLGRVDKKGRLVSADPQLEELQRQAGSSLGKALALPQIAAIASLARKLGIPVARPAIAASSEKDIEPMARMPDWRSSDSDEPCKSTTAASSRWVMVGGESFVRSMLSCGCFAAKR